MTGAATAYFMLMKYSVSKQDTRLLQEVGYLEYLTYLKSAVIANG